MKRIVVHSGLDISSYTACAAIVSKTFDMRESHPFEIASSDIAYEFPCELGIGWAERIS